MAKFLMNMLSTVFDTAKLYWERVNTRVIGRIADTPFNMSNLLLRNMW